jgi:hypothetical protein
MICALISATFVITAPNLDISRIPDEVLDLYAPRIDAFPQRLGDASHLQTKRETHWLRSPFRT